MPLDAELVDSRAALAPLADVWDELAVAAGRPFCAPAWMLAWLDHAAGAEVAPRVIVVRDGGEPVALAPFVLATSRVGVRRLSLMAGVVSAGVDVLARPERAREAAGAVRSAVGDLGADVAYLDGVPAESAWPELLTGGPPYRDVTVPAPLIELAGGHDAWLAGRTGSFRRRMRQLRRRLEQRGAVWRLTRTAAELPRDLAAFSRLHRARWDFRGGSGVLTAGVDAMVAQAGRELLPSGRFRLWSLEADGEIVCSQLFLAAGRRCGWWLGGFDPAWARESPTLALLDRIVADAFERDEDVLDLGAGDQPYKERFATGAARVDWTLVPLGPLRGRAVVAARRARRRVARLVRRRP
jgi:CelD/BcsL family acetyltransferase involved in cellulose biosynthesis